MAYVNMFNNEQQSLYSSFIDPRISFSSDFTDTQQAIKHDEIKYKEAPVSLDFEFSAKNNAMIPADEIFFDGVLLPLKGGFCGNHGRKVTLREELSADDDDDGSLSMNMAKGSCWWKERLGLKSKNDHKKASFAHEEGFVSNKTQNCLARILECDN